MKIEYQETSNDLMTRIDIHNQYGKDIDPWMLDLLKPAKGSKILDVGCGAGKLCFSFNKYLNSDCEITGGDFNQELLEKARAENTRQGTDIRFIELDFNKRFPFEDNQFDLVSCSFAIYYAEDIPFTISELHRVTKPGGRLFTTGPMPTNKQVFYDIIKEATGLPIPPMPGSSRYASAILDSMKKYFSDVKVDVFENPLVFETAEPFLAYTRASLSEDRKLWKSFFQDKSDFEKIMTGITNVANARIQRDGKIIMTKVVGGFVCTK